MIASKKHTRQIAEILAEALHACKSPEERAGVLRARNHLLDAINEGNGFEHYCEGAKAFAQKVSELEPLEGERA